MPNDGAAYLSLLPGDHQSLSALITDPRPPPVSNLNLIFSLTSFPGRQGAWGASFFLEIPSLESTSYHQFNIPGLLWQTYWREKMIILLNSIEQNRNV